MEILSTTEHIGMHIFAMLFLSVASLFFVFGMLAGLHEIIAEKNIDIDTIGMTIACSIMAFLLVSALIYGDKHGASVTYKATISDFNEVYNNGYKITGRDGELYILEKDREWEND